MSAQESLYEMAENIDLEGYFIAIARSRWRQFHDYIQTNVLCPLKTLAKSSNLVVKYIFNQLFTHNSTFWKNVQQNWKALPLTFIMLV